MQRFLSEVIAGLSAEPKTLPCKYFYDERGSQLFNEICGLDEYYLTRADLEITRARAGEIAARVGPRCRLLELGCGDAVKTRILLDHLSEPACYVPIDIAAEQLAETAAALRASYPALEVLPICADYASEVPLPEPSRPARATVVYFPGSTIGNFHPPDAASFLRRIRAAIAVGPEPGAAIIGVDLKKDRATLEAAYDDARGVTAAFNLNLLARIDRELGADFDLAAFQHRARYDEALGRIEMHLVSVRDQTVHVGGRAFSLRAGETIRSEESYKYAPEELAQLASQAGLRQEAVWLDRAGRFSVQYLVPA